MYKLIRYASLLTLTLSATAMAAPANPVNPVDPTATLGSVVTHMIGTITPNPTLLENLGVTLPQGTSEVAYDLTLTSYTDWGRGRPGDDGNIGLFPNQLAVDFKIGGAEYHYEGAGGSTVYLDFGGVAGRYSHILGFPVSNETHPSGFLYFYSDTYFTPGTFATDGPFTPGRVASGPSSASIDVDYEYHDPWQEDARHLRMFDYGAASSVDVTSPVPEPAGYAMLAAGVLGLALRRRLARRRA